MSSDEAPSGRYAARSLRGQGIVMHWFVLLDGESRGPVEASTFAAWRQQGLVAPSTLVWSDGMPQWAPASQTSLASVFESGVGGHGGGPLRPEAPPAVAPAQPPPGGPVQTTVGQHGRVVPPPQQSPAGPFSIAAIVCGCVAILFFPILFGPIAIVLAGVGMARDERLAKLALGVAIGGTVVGMVLGAIVGFLSAL